jgi:hypothetical protein
VYETLKAAKSFWLLLSRKLQVWGFEINMYDLSVANKMIIGKQCTIIWHVDDLKISRIDSKMVDDVIILLEGEFGKEAPLTVTRGNMHDFLGMRISATQESSSYPWNPTSCPCSRRYPTT